MFAAEEDGLCTPGATATPEVAPPWQLHVRQLQCCGWLIDCPLDFKPMYYKRYVDDLFLIFKDKCIIFTCITFCYSKTNPIYYFFKIM